MSATNLFEDDLLDLIFTNVAAPNVGDAAGLQPSAAAGSFFISLHTATLADTNSQQSDNEAAYVDYARQGVARSVAEWTVASGVADNDNPITFPEAGAGTVEETITDTGIGFADVGVGVLQMFAAVLSSLIVNAGIVPEFAAGALDISLD